jgi:hypothetical protein
MPGLADRSSRPHTMPTRTPAAVEDQILAVRRTQTLGTRPNRRAVGSAGPHRVAGACPPLRACDPMTGEVVRASKATAVR